MKLINKLLPVATLGSVAAIITPLTTSCASGYTYNIDLLKSIDTNGWAIAEYDSEPTLEEAVEDYYEAISEDHDILIHDFMWGARTNIIFEFIDLLYADEVKFIQTSLQFSDIQPELIDDTICLSYKAKIDLEFKFKISGSAYIPPYMPNGSIMGIHAEANLKKVPFNLIDVTELGTPMLRVAFIEAGEIETDEYDWDWSLDLDGSVRHAAIRYETEDVFEDYTQIISGHVNKDNLGSLYGESNLAFSAMLVAACCMFYSYYFVNTIIAK